MPNRANDAFIELDADIDQALADLRQAFPGICIWYGEFCGSLWALLPDRLAEAKNAAGLARQLRAALGPPRPIEGAGCGASPPRRRDGTWSAPRHDTVRRPHRSRGRGRLLARLLGILVPLTGSRAR
ncbi:hypothetical protein [Actinomadura sp. WMMB 499]|uniref:hypothetical protein n=1 Tax=Actinomadura sp. WMMB 499 TaxID=1219491 RepID=UPI001243C880|nr:hypothetical protein [Actinomadura sp. WMMB 499]QFG22078.1 hypothetical protein F7P10_14040 [Actinomadura sp. WMMB 499]